MKLGIGTFVTDDGIAPGRLARAVEERGFDALFVAEHSHIPIGETAYPWGEKLTRPYFRGLDPFVALTAAASATEHLRIGTAIMLLVQRDPIQTAKAAASLDLVSGGRLILGIGAGWNQQEMRNHGTDPRTRGALLDERIAAMKEIWANERAEFHGKYVNFDPIFSWPKPVQNPHPPLYIGGNSPAAMARAAAHGDGWMPNPVAEASQVRDQLDQLAEVAGKDLPVTVANVAQQPELAAAYAEAGVAGLTFLLAPAPEDETLPALDQLAAFAERFR